MIVSAAELATPTLPTSRFKADAALPLMLALRLPPMKTELTAVGTPLGVQLSVAAVYVAKSRVLKRIREEADGLID